ncbi:hypothetical protein F511_37898 [Dorcoceras hygrometricum]|uniref:Uncharacterized protein n=1 Tax=Dorcoceras hygrometricum TaxID=472368 RepID=A0A2Z7C3K0_9LAMI|nr:hypothetical protein F511_37898 [Dorcoceras hygrometricum]
MIVVLKTKDKLGFVDCSIDRPLKFRSLSGTKQGSMDISLHYTKLRTLLDELRDHQHTSGCNCGSLKELMGHQNQDHIMHFLFGLSDSCTNSCTGPNVGVSIRVGSGRVG